MTEQFSSEGIMNDAAEGLQHYYNCFNKYPDFIVDIGAHHGGCSLCALEHGAMDVIAIEASPSNYSILYNKVDEKYISRIDLLNVLFCELGRGNMKPLWHIVSSNTGQYSACYDTLNSNLKKVTCVAQDIRTINIDDLRVLCEHKTIDYLKCDIEGAEFDAFPMNAKTKEFLSGIRYIDFEIHDPENKDYFNRKSFLERHKEFDPNCSITEQYMNFLIECGFAVTKPAMNFDSVLGAKVFAENVYMREVVDNAKRGR